MGFFSWKTSDTNKSISNYYSVRGTFPVYLLCPNGEKIREDNYGGYGIFGGHDAYALLAKWNCPEDCKDEAGNWLPDAKLRDLGIDLAFSHKELKYTLKFVENYNLDYEDVEPSKDCEDQGYFYEDGEYKDEEDYYF